jgi:hypothetical protein
VAQDITVANSVTAHRRRVGPRTPQTPGGTGKLPSRPARLPFLTGRGKIGRINGASAMVPRTIVAMDWTTP